MCQRECAALAGAGKKPRFLPRRPIGAGAPYRAINMGWKTGFEPATLGITIRCSNRLSYIHHIFALLARPEGVEPPTDGVEVRCSIQLSYGRPTPDCAPGGPARHHATLFELVGVEGFEPPTSCSQSRRATRLRYTPMHRNRVLRDSTDTRGAASGGAQSSMAARGRRRAGGGSCGRLQRRAFIVNWAEGSGARRSRRSRRGRRRRRSG